MYDKTDPRLLEIARMLETLKRMIETHNPPWLNRKDLERITDILQQARQAWPTIQVIGTLANKQPLVASYPAWRDRRDIYADIQDAIRSGAQIHAVLWEDGVLELWTSKSVK